MAEETIILNLQVDQGAAERQLEKIEGLLLDNKKAVADLQAAYKKGTITQEEYVKENIRLQQNIKKEQDQKKVLIKTIETESNSRNALKNRVSQLTKEYDSLNTSTATGIKRADQLEKELAQLNAQLNKGDKAAGLFKNQIGNYPRVLQDAASNIRVAGVSVADVGTRLTALANPITATIGLVGALGAAYTRSTIGAKDLEFASNQLGNSITLTANKFAEFISSAEDGEGILSRALDSAADATDVILDLFTFGGTRLLGFSAADINKEAKALALLTEKLEDLGRLEQEVRTNNNQLLEDNQGLLEQIADDQTTITQKAQAANTAEQNILRARDNLLSVMKQELSVIEDQREKDPNSETLLNLAIAKRREISNESRSFEKQLTRIQKQQTDLNQQVAQQVALEKEINRLKGAPGTDLSPEGFDFAGGIDDAALASTEKTATEGLELAQKTEAQKRAEYIQTGQIYAQVNREQLDNDRAAAQAKLAIASSIANGLAGIAEDASDAQRVLALVGIGVDTASALASGIAASQDIPYPGNLVAMASTIATILANIAQAKTYIEGFADGGYTGDGGKYEPKGVVHGGEFVIPKATVSQYGKEHFNKYLPQYADGGFVANQSTAPINQALIMANALKNLPRPIVDVREVTSKQRNIEVRENVSTLAR